jgi:transposase
MAKIQKVYTREFKEEAVRLAQTSGKPITQMARKLGISDTLIHQWRKELAQHGQEAFLPSYEMPSVFFKPSLIFKSFFMAAFTEWGTSPVSPA